MTILDIPRTPAVPPPAPEPSLARRPRTRRTSTRDASPATSRREPTAAGRRVGGDHPVWFALQVGGLLVVIASALTISATALVVVGGWQQTPDVIDPVTVTMIDGPMLVAFFCQVTFKWRGFTGWLWGARVFGGIMTAASASANFAYTVSASAAVNGTTGLSTYQEWTGALVHAAAPVLVNVSFEFFGQVITRPQRNARRLERLTLKELRRVQAEIEKRQRAVAAAEAKAAKG